MNQNPVARHLAIVGEINAMVNRLFFNAALPLMKLDEAARKAARAALGIAPDAEPIEWFRIQNFNAQTVNAAGTQTKKTAEILIYDVIDPWGVSAGDFANALNELDVDEITVGINSPGGIVFDGIAIMNALKRHPAKVIARIDGMAASAASFIAMAGDEIQTSKYAEMMIHEARGYVAGTAADMKEFHDLLIRHNDSIASVYADRAGGDVKDWLKLMRNETWFTAEEMVAAGLADTIIETSGESSEADEAESLKNQFDLTVFNYAGRGCAPTPEIRNSVRSERPRKEPTMGLKETLAEKYGLDPELGDDEFNAALDAKITAPPAEGEPAEPTPEQISARAKELGLVMVDADTLNALKTQSQQGSEAFAAIQAQSDAQMVEEAIRAGKIAPAARDKWLKNLASPARDTFMDALKDLEAVFPVQEIGSGLNPDPGASMKAPDDLSWFDTAATAPADATSEGE